MTSMALITNSTMGSSLPSMAIPAMAQEWGVTSQVQLVLPMSCYLIGYVFGPIFCKTCSFPPSKCPGSGSSVFWRC